MIFYLLLCIVNFLITKSYAQNVAGSLLNAASDGAAGLRQIVKAPADIISNILPPASVNLSVNGNNPNGQSALANRIRRNPLQTTPSLSSGAPQTIILINASSEVLASLLQATTNNAIPNEPSYSTVSSPSPGNSGTANSGNLLSGPSTQNTQTPVWTVGTNLRSNLLSFAGGAAVGNTDSNLSGTSNLSANSSKLNASTSSNGSNSLGSNLNQPNSALNSNSANQYDTKQNGSDWCPTNISQVQSHTQGINSRPSNPNIATNNAPNGNPGVNFQANSPTGCIDTSTGRGISNTDESNSPALNDAMIMSTNSNSVNKDYAMHSISTLVNPGEVVSNAVDVNWTDDSSMTSTSSPSTLRGVASPSSGSNNATVSEQPYLTFSSHQDKSLTLSGPITDPNLQLTDIASALLSEGIVPDEEINNNQVYWVDANNNAYTINDLRELLQYIN